MVNYQTLNLKIADFETKTKREKFETAQLVYKTLAQFDPEKVREVLINREVLKIYDRAKFLVEDQVKKGMILYPDPQKNLMGLLFPDSQKDVLEDFFDIEKFAKKLGKDLLEIVIILGFFMNESRMNTIQAYNLLTEEVRDLL